MLIHPNDAATRGIVSGDIVELFNDRGRCLVGAKVTDEIREGCVFLWTGAWYDPDFAAPQNRDRLGNPNALTHDHRTSSLSQGIAAHSTLLEMFKFEGPAPEIKAHVAPDFLFLAEPDTTAELE
ncbi:molybdopterin dinucleotide binding domain-containing protein [Shimia sp.]|uniref:molybdopterin dinucleotide binding domain-containing protein n=1 Tax=Shimia sp. TaxID=1954381 RepID=UPI003297A7FC